jgi:hypothetical protein
MRFGTWNVRSLCRLGAIKSVFGEVEKYTSDYWESKRLSEFRTEPEYKDS